MCERGKPQTFGPISVSITLGGNLISPYGAGSGGNGYTATANFLILRYLRVVNTGPDTAKVRLWKGATGGTAAGTEIAQDIALAAGESWEFRGAMRLEGTSGFLTGSLILGTSASLIAEGEVGVV